MILDLLKSVANVGLCLVPHVQVLAAFKRFGERLDEAEAAMKERNKKELPNRIGPAKVPYTLLYPKSDTPGLTGMGVPNSVTI